MNGIRKGQNLTHVKSRNLSTVLETIIRLEPISRIAISSLTGLTSSTITNLVNELIHHGLVRESGSVASQGGRRRTLLRLNADACWLGALSVGQSRIQGALLNLTAQVRWHVDEPYTDASRACEQLAKRLVDFAAIQGQPLVGFCIVSPSHANLTHGLSDDLQIPVKVDLPVRACALAEAWYGVGRELSSMAFVSVDHPWSVALVTERRLYRGTHGLSGLLPKLQCPRDCPPTADAPLSPESLESLAVTIALAMGLYDPEAVVVGGSNVSQLPELLAVLMNCDVINQQKEVYQQVVFRTSELGQEAELIGAACHILQDFIADPIGQLTGARLRIETAAEA
ncbi:MAG: ROK family transcriptional regulator [Limnochordia bacterium]